MTPLEKSRAMLATAFDTAAEGKRVFYQFANHRNMIPVFHEAQHMVEDRPDDIEKVYLARGNERIYFVSGGSILFLSHEPRGFANADVHLIDSGASGPPFTTAPIVIRGDDL